jgi:hypothetical protein
VLGHENVSERMVKRRKTPEYTSNDTGIRVNMEQIIIEIELQVYHRIFTNRSLIGIRAGCTIVATHT